MRSCETGIRGGQGVSILCHDGASICQYICRIMGNVQVDLTYTCRMLAMAKFNGVIIIKSIGKLFIKYVI